MKFFFADIVTVVEVVRDDQPKDVKVEASKADLEQCREVMKTEVSFHKSFGARGLFLDFYIRLFLKPSFGIVCPGRALDGGVQAVG